MPIITIERLYQAVKNKTQLSTEFSAIDHQCLFMPQELTQLYHTAFYTQLTGAQKLRYNQLFSLRAIEQLMTLEARFISLVIKRSQQSPLLRENKPLQYCMREMIKEEVEHYHMFRALNQLAEPAIYQQQDLYFARMSHSERLTLELLALLPGINALLLWILLILEEFSTHISHQMVLQAESSSIPLEKNFVKAHREHLKDESRHVAICANALNELLQQSSGTAKKINARLLTYFMHEYMAPKHGGIRVIKHLCQEFPELKKQQGLMIQIIGKQSPDPLIWGAIHSVQAMPATNQMMRIYPEFALKNELLS